MHPGISRHSRHPRAGLGALRLASALIVIALVAGCSTPPPPQVEEPPGVEAVIAFRLGQAAYHEIRIREAHEHLHRAVHLDRENLEAQDLLLRTGLLASCGPASLPCTSPSYRGRPDVWLDLGENLQQHVEASLEEAERLRHAGRPWESEDFARCAHDLTALIGAVSKR